MTEPSTDGQRHPRDLRGIPLRGILIGAILALVLNVCDAYATNVIRGSYLTLNFSTPAALFFFFLLVLLSGLVGLLHRALALSRSELITIYIMLVMSCTIATQNSENCGMISSALLGYRAWERPSNEREASYIAMAFRGRRSSRVVT